MYIYIYTYIQIELIGNWPQPGYRTALRANLHTPSPPTKSFDFRGFDSSKLLILRDGNFHIR